jgi:hypothetical protein
MFIVILEGFKLTIIENPLFYVGLISIIRVECAFLLLIVRFVTFILHFLSMFIECDVMSGFINLI